jgi:hypothetical protein
VFFAQEREITLTWSIAEKYIGHFFCKGTQCSEIFFSAEKTPFILQNLSFGWKIFRPFFYTVSIANF